MMTEIPLIHPDTPAGKIFDSMVSGRTRFVLVGRDPENVEGIITRMDLLRYHYEISPARMALRKGRQSENLSPMFEESCLSEFWKYWKTVVRLQKKMG